MDGTVYAWTQPFHEPLVQPPMTSLSLPHPGHLKNKDQLSYISPSSAMACTLTRSTS
jgi:hypothetical protein